RLSNHVVKAVCPVLGQKVRYEATMPVRQHLEGLTETVVKFLGELLTATPPGRLLVPRAGSAFDPERHEAIYGRPASGEDVILEEVLFPGYVVLAGGGVRVVEKALVYTARRKPATPIPAPALSPRGGAPRAGKS